MADETTQAPAKAVPKAKPLPGIVILTETIGWMRGNALIQFHDGDTVSNPDDIAELVANGAQFWEVK